LASFRCGWLEAVGRFESLRRYNVEQTLLLSLFRKTEALPKETPRRVDQVIQKCALAFHGQNRPGSPYLIQAGAERLCSIACNLGGSQLHYFTSPSFPPIHPSDNIPLFQGIL